MKNLFRWDNPLIQLLTALADVILAQGERADPVASVKRRLMEERGLSEEKAYRRIATHAKTNALSMEAAALDLRKRMEAGR